VPALRLQIQEISFRSGENWPRNFVLPKLHKGIFKRQKALERILPQRETAVHICGCYTQGSIYELSVFDFTIGSCIYFYIANFTFLYFLKERCSKLEGLLRIFIIVPVSLSVCDYALLDRQETNQFDENAVSR
jgi:hypothetical protein